MADISQALGDFMLKGYVLTDQSCPTRGCAIPMLRTPKGPDNIPVTFCVKCSDGGSSTASPKTPVSSESSRPSRSSTAPTDVSEALVSTHSDFELPPETDDMRQRREQSDRASSEIGKRLLQGWTMLGDECPNEGCYGVPLVCPSRATGAARKECVVCGTTYKTEINWAGEEILIPYNDNTVPVLSSAPLTQQRRTFSPLTHSLDSNLDIPIRDKNRSTERKPRLTATSDILDEVSEALQVSLQALSSQLRRLSSSANLDVNSIGMTADAIGKTTQALGQVRQMFNSIAT